MRMTFGERPQLQAASRGTRHGVRYSPSSSTGARLGGNASALLVVLLKHRNLVA